MKTVTRIYQNTPAGRRQIGYRIDEIRNGRIVRPVARLERTGHRYDWCWRALHAFAAEIAKPHSRFLDRFSLKRGLVDLRQKRTAVPELPMKIAA